MKNISMILSVLILVSACASNDSDKKKLAEPWSIKENCTRELSRIDKIHVVKNGESIYRIAREYRVDPWLVVRINKLSKPYVIEPKHRLRIPQQYVILLKDCHIAGVSGSPPEGAYDAFLTDLAKHQRQNGVQILDIPAKGK